jgi:hypothetical protein
MALAMPALRNRVARYSTLGPPPAQRLKRLIQIVRKLQRHEAMKLSRMQGGGREHERRPAPDARPVVVAVFVTSIDRGATIER